MQKKNVEPRFRTHIKEPRWQQIASVIVLLTIIIAWLWVIARH